MDRQANQQARVSRTVVRRDLSTHLISVYVIRGLGLRLTSSSEAAVGSASRLPNFLVERS